MFPYSVLTPSEYFATQLVVCCCKAAVGIPQSQVMCKHARDSKLSAHQTLKFHPSSLRPKILGKWSGIVTAALPIASPMTNNGTNSKDRTEPHSCAAVDGGKLSLLEIAYIFEFPRYKVCKVYSIVTGFLLPKQF